MRSKILDNYLIRQMLTNWFAVTTVLLVIMVGNVLARSLGRVTEGTIAPDAVLALVGVKSISLLVTLIPLGLYLGVLLALGRFYRDNEMSVMQACGVGLKDIFRPAAIVGLAGVTLISVLTVYASPWSARQEEVLKIELAEQSGLGLLSAGRFIESSNGDTVFFTQSIDPSRRQFENVFMYRKREEKLPAVDTARFASYQVDPDNGDEYLVFNEGQSSVGNPGEAEYTLTTFKRQGVLRQRRDSNAPQLRTRGKSLTQLWQSSDLADRAELQWRISIPLAALILALLAVPLSHTTPRQGRYARIALAILIYIPYANLLVLARKWIANGTNPVWIGLWPVHMMMLLLIIYLVSRRVGWRWLRMQGLKGL